MCLAGASGEAANNFVLDLNRLYYSRWTTYTLAYNGKCKVEGTTNDFKLKVRQTNYGGSISYFDKEGLAAGSPGVEKETSKSVSLVFRDGNPATGNPTPGTTVDIQARANTKYALTKIDRYSKTNEPILEGLNSEVGKIYGDFKANENGPTNLVRTRYVAEFGNTSTAYDFAALTFSEQTEPNKHWEDIKVTIMNCVKSNTNISGSTIEAEFPTIEGWARIIHPDGVDDISVKESPAPGYGPNKVRWHRDQDNQIYLSADYGPFAGRWMLHNVRAKTFDTVRDGDVATVNKFNAQITSHNSGSLAIGLSPVGSAGGIITRPYYAFPGTRANSANFDKAPRMGLLYSWYATVMGEIPLTSAETRDLRNLGPGGTDGNGTNAHPQIQGVCPSGWHVPSDLEWTQLENEFVVNTHKYAFEPDIYVDENNLVRYAYNQANPAQFYPRQPSRPYKDPCVDVGTFAFEWQRKAYNGGTSFPLHLGGFSVLYPGTIDVSGTANTFNSMSRSWTSSRGPQNPASGTSSNFIIGRNLYAFDPTMKSDIESLGNLRSVRCVQNGSNPNVESGGLIGSQFTERKNKRTPGDY